MRKTLRFLLFSLLVMICGVSFAQTTVTFDVAVDKSASADAGEVSITKDGVTIATTQGIFGNGSQYRIYKSQTFTVTSTEGNIQKIEFTCTASGTAKYGPGCFTDPTAGTYTYDGEVGTWVGDAASVSLTASLNQVRATKIVVTIGSANPDAVAAPVMVRQSLTPQQRLLSLQVKVQAFTTHSTVQNHHHQAQLIQLLSQSTRAVLLALSQ